MATERASQPASGFSWTYEPLTDEQFRKFSSLVYRLTGIYLRDEKKALLNARLSKRLRAGSFASFDDYFQYVTSDDSGQELVELINSVSTNFTSFFREQDHFDCLVQTVLPELTGRLRDHRRELTLWSAACSSGEEPYTMAMVLAEYFRQQPGWRYRITGTDISTRVLDRASRGVYSQDQISKVPRELLLRYFKKGVGRSEGLVKVREDLRRQVTFQRFNLMDPFPWTEAFDVIFCRNVMIYFDQATQQALIDKFHRALLPDGHLFIGHSESLTFIRHSFRQVATTVYRK
ncbi:MAG: protein-glutamate O-methyltransferase [Thermodesulfobacteriota bacterium]